jgi:hypothetical protein
MKKLRIVILRFGTARMIRLLERWTDPKPLQPIWDRAAILLRGVLDLSIIQSPFSITKCLTLISRFATFSSRYNGPVMRVYDACHAAPNMAHDAQR